MFADAQQAYQALLSQAASRGSSEDWFSFAHLLHENHWFGAAAAGFARAWQQDENNFRALANWGWNLHLSGRSAEGADKLQDAVLAAPNEGLIRALYSQVLRVLGEDREAVVQAREGVRLAPGLPLTHLSLAFSLMTVGEWLEGFTEYEHRFAEELPALLTRPFRLWRGERVGHLYLEGEQGLGDTIMALRWLEEACSRADRVTLYVQGPLYQLVRRAFRLPGNAKVLPLPQALPVDVDAFCPLMSLPAALELRQPMGGGRPYISPAREGGEYGRFVHPTRKSVGIAWAGSPEHKAAHSRDCPLAYWLRLAEIPGVELHSLQLGEAAGQMTQLAAFGLVADRSAELTNMLDTAEIIAGLDLVITVDTAVAHLAGAMGKPCWMLVNQMNSDFRWGRGETTGWYPSLRLYWRRLSEQWSDVMLRVDHDLRNVVG